MKYAEILSKNKLEIYQTRKQKKNMYTSARAFCSKESNQKQNTTKESLITREKGTEDITKKHYHNQKTDIKKKRKTITPYNSKKKKIKGVLGKIYISSTKNNTILTLIDTKGNTKGWSCSGSLGFKNARKSTTYAAQAAAESIVNKAKILGYTHLRLLAKGLGRGKQSCLRALTKSGLKVISVEDKTAIPYNGCRASKKRRV